MKSIVLLSILFGVALCGCTGGAEADVTKTQEDAFRSKSAGPMPPEIAAQMQKSREEGMRKAEEMRKKAAGG
jgi:hypothetical protein